jgi:hypothetical protein
MCAIKVDSILQVDIMQCEQYQLFGKKKTFCHSLVTIEDGGSRTQNNNSHNVPNFMSSYPLPRKLNNSIFCHDYVTTTSSSSVSSVPL